MKVNKPTCDQDIRDKLLGDLRSDINNLKVINELDLMNARADIAVIDNKYFSGYEIKSDRDSLKRLPMQIQIYGYVFDKITIVVDESKLRKVSKIIPTFWGIIVATRDVFGEIILTDVRMPRLNRKINKRWLSNKLWRSDIVRILKTKNLYKGRSGCYKGELLGILIDNTSLRELKYYVRAVLINRVY